ncbi:MAG: hypothetical protein ABWY06_12490 [Pseudomonas sp.]|uniref:hypothetical protein n=1 Tax=Pseudomonas sp. TaxID=306 RepID=UPI003390872C
MSSGTNKVIHLHQRDPQAALKRLNRVTGLRFSRWPESLAPAPQQDEAGPSVEPTTPVSVSGVA